MENTRATAPPRRLPRSAGRALALVGLGTGLWLLGAAGSPASADDVVPTSRPVVSLASDLLAPVGEGVAPVTQQVVVPAATSVMTPVVRDVVTPTVDQVVVPFAHEVVVPVVD